MKQKYLKTMLLSSILLLSLTSLHSQEARKKKQLKFESSAKHKLTEAKELMRKNLQLASDDNLIKTKTENDKVGFTHEKYQQYFKNIKVEFGTYKVHAKNGFIKTMDGELYSPGKLKIKPTLSKSAAFQKAISHTGAKHYMWEYPEAAKEMDNYKKPEGELLILPGEVIGQKEARLAYKFDIFATKPLSRGYLYIDAQSGEVLFFNAIIKHAETFGHIGEPKNVDKVKKNESLNNILATGSAQTRYSGTQSIETSVSGSNYILSDAGRKVYTRDALNQAPGSSYPYVSNYSQFTDNDNNWTTAEHSANKDDAALDAHWGAMMTYDYWQQKHSRNSYDGNGAQIRSYVHVDSNYDNAFWNGSVMSYGDGTSNGNEGNGNFDALTSIDVAAHEIGHAVCTYTADLAYQRESGGLNEGFSDIWGAAVEHFAKGNGNDLSPNSAVWLIGDEIDRRSGSPALRSMSDPKSLGQPDTYGGTYWQNPNCGTPTSSNDYCGVHTNSGVLNHWFYLLTKGGSGTNDVSDSYSVTGIGITKAANISYRLESFYLSANSTYANARTGAIQAAEDLYGTGSLEVIATTNAWYAVGVGAEYVQTCALSAPSNLAISSITDNSFSISWNAVSSAASYTVSVGGNSTIVSGTSYSATGLVPGTSYSVSVSANCSSGGSGTSSNTNATTTGSAPLNYCDSASTNVNDEYIGKVQLGTINNTSGGQFYTDFTNISTDLTKGDNYTITVTPTWTGTTYNEGYAVWIDYNIDGDFNDAGEQVWSQSATSSSTVSGTFTVSASATNGYTRMRVSMKYNGIPTSCETFTYGEVEDYTVNLGDGTPIPDTTPPVITLNGASTINLTVGDSYTEQGATATDNVDGSLTSSIVISGSVNTASAGTYTITYSVSDAANNSASTTRTVIVSEPAADTTAPVINLNGASTIDLTVGDTYTEQGATATDNVDGNLTSSIVISGSVNTATAGTYTVTYSVSDAANNSASTTRTIIVSEPSSGSTTVLHEGYFESGWDNWADGGSDVARYSGSRSYEGSYSIRLRDNSGTASAMTSQTFNLTSYDSVEVEFYFYSYSMESGEDFWVRFYNGSTWTTVAAYAQGTSFSNNTFYVATVTLDATQYNFASNSQFRFQCDASNNSDYIYIDAVTIKGIVGSGSAVSSIQSLGGLNNGIVAGSTTPESYFEGDFKIYPNPVKNVLNIQLFDNTIGTFKIVNLLGQTVKTGKTNEGTINVSKLKQGVYLLEVNDGEEVMVQKFIKQ